MEQLFQKTQYSKLTISLSDINAEDKCLCFVGHGLQPRCDYCLCERWVSTQLLTETIQETVQSVVLEETKCSAES